MILQVERLIYDKVGGPRPKPDLILFFFKSKYKAVIDILTSDFESRLD